MSKYDTKQLHELIYQMVETERGGEQVYLTALRCAKHPDLKKEWQEYLEETRTHQTVIEGVCQALGLDPDAPSPGRAVVKHQGESLVKAMEMARQSGPADAAQLVACECVVLAETKDHLNWELLGKVAEAATGNVAKVLGEAYRAVETDEDHHLYHTTGWCRELWIKSLGMPAVQQLCRLVAHLTGALRNGGERHARQVAGQLFVIYADNAQLFRYRNMQALAGL